MYPLSFCLADGFHHSSGLRKIRKEVFSAQHGSRKNQGVPQIAVLVTHSPSQDNVTKAAVNLRRQGVTIFTIGVEGASNTQLEKIASHPAEQYVSQLRSFSDLAAHNQTFLKKLRNQITHTVSRVTVILFFVCEVNIMSHFNHEPPCRPCQSPQYFFLLHTGLLCVKTQNS